MTRRAISLIYLAAVASAAAALSLLLRVIPEVALWGFGVLAVVTAPAGPLALFAVVAGGFVIALVWSGVSGLSLSTALAVVAFGASAALQITMVGGWRNVSTVRSRTQSMTEAPKVAKPAG